MPDRLEDAGLLRLLAWTSPGFPVGGYAFSHGLETAVVEGVVADRNSLESAIGAILGCGGGLADGALLAHAWRAARAGDGAKLDEVAEFAEAFRPTAELALESAAQGRAFGLAVAAGWPAAWADPRLAPLRARPAPAYAVAVGAVAGAVGLPMRPTLLAFLHALAAALVSAGVRLIPLGQSEGVRTLSALEASIVGAADEAQSLDLDALGGCAWMIDLWSAIHETQHTRLFRS